MSPRRLRLLISAYACEPGEGSEPGVGWNWVKHAATLHEVWVITRANNRGPIERALKKEPLPGGHFVYFDLPRWLTFWKKKQRGVRLYYYFWQAGAYFAARRLLRSVSFDAAHHLTFGMYWMPTFLALLPLPFLWGPVGGGESPPLCLWPSLGWRGIAFEALRSFVRTLARFDPFVRLTARRAQVALAKTEDTAERLRSLGSRNVRVMSEAGLSWDEVWALSGAPIRDAGPLRIASIGRLVPFKGFRLGLEAFAAFARRHLDSEYWIIGDGKERLSLERLAGHLGIRPQVKFLGKIERDRVLDRLSECDVLMHPSLHDSGGWVCLEAMAAGRPVLCLDLGGPGFQVTAETGYKVPPASPGRAVQDLANALDRLSGNFGLRLRMGEMGRRLIRERFLWDSKGDPWSELVSAAGGER